MPPERPRGDEAETRSNRMRGGESGCGGARGRGRLAAMESLPTWRLDDLYADLDDPKIAGDLAAVAAEAEAFGARWEGRIEALDGDGLAELLGAYSALLSRMYRPQMFASLSASTDALDEAVKALSARVNEQATAIGNALRFVDVALANASPEAHARWAASPACAGLLHHLQRARAARPHTLDAAVESALATKDLTGRRAWSRLYDELCAAWRFDFTVEGETQSLNLAALRSLREDPDRAVRRRASEAILTRFSEHAPTFAYIVNTLYQDHKLETALRRYTDVAGPTLLDDELPRATLDALLTAVEAHYPVAQRFFAAKARALGLPRLESHDLLAPFPGGDRLVSWAEARAEVLGAFGALDPEIEADARAFFDDRRIDARPRPGKRDGAFCAGMVPGVAPRVLVNFHGRLRDVYTLAHELGHGVHFTLAGKAQRLLNYWPTSPMAETASVFGEMVLTRRLLARETDPDVRRQLLAARIEEALGTIHRQVAFTRYELNAHLARARANLSTDDLSALWSAESERLYGDAVQRGALDRWGWVGIPHLVHYRFYCYSYAFGQLLVFALYRLWEQEGEAFVPKYKRLLASGGCDTPASLLAALGIDITDPSFWARGLDVVTEMVDAFVAEEGAAGE